ncbi:MAG: hypothetical protein OHK0029_38110 [Armatimonadaceae bacterium]
MAVQSVPNPSRRSAKPDYNDSPEFALDLNQKQGMILKVVCVLVAVTAFLGTAATLRFKHAGAWLPENVPNQIGYWQGVDAPLGKETLEALGNPRAVGRRYISPLKEIVEASIVTAGEFENYHDPTVCVPGNGFALTSKKIFNLNGCNIRAMVFKRTSPDPRFGEIRMLMYYWQQSRDGATDTAARMGSYRDIQARFDTGFGAVVQGKQTVLCRVYTIIAPDDPDGIQAQRNVEMIAQEWYRKLKEGSGS